jgi:hypothetical protein
MLGALAAIEAALQAHGIPVGDGGLRRAVLKLAGAAPARATHMPA